MCWWVVVIGSAIFLGYIMGNPDKFFPDDKDRKDK